MVDPLAQRHRNRVRGHRSGHRGANHTPLQGQGHVPGGQGSTLVAGTGSTSPLPSGPGSAGLDNTGAAGHVPSTAPSRRPAVGGGVPGTGALTGRGPAQVHDKRVNLRDVVTNPAYAARDPAALLQGNPQAQALSELIDKSQRILLVGHVSPDGDCVGSTVSLARALKALGKQVDVVVDDRLSLSLQQLVGVGEVKRASEVASRSWDAAIVLDVAEAGRIGGAAALLQQAATVGVVDHHVAKPTPEALGLKPGSPLLAWVEPDYPAASLQSAAFLSRYTDELRRRGVDLKHVFLPALAGFATDTGFGNFQGSAREFFPYFKHMLQKSAGATMDELEGALKTPMPQRLLDEVHGLGWTASDGAGARPLPEQVRAALGKAHREHRAIESTVHQGARGRLGVVTVHSEYFGALLRLAQHEDPRITALDVANLIKWDCIAELGRREHCDVTALLSEQRDGSVKVSTRSRAPKGHQGPLPEHARLLAESLGGGGHGPAAGASVHRPLGAVKDAVLAWARAQGFAR